MSQRTAWPWLAGVLTALLLTACTSPSAEGDGRLRAVATISILADFVAQVGGDRIDVASVVHLDGDPHTYEPTPSDARILADADIVFRNGLGLERWLDRLVDAATEEQPVITLTEGLPAVTDDALGDIDPHLWMDPELARGYVRAVERALVEADPAGAAHYAERATAYLAELSHLHTWMGEAFAEIPPERRKLVTSHDAFRYMGERYGLEVVGSVWGISTEREPSADEIRRLVDVIRAEEVPAVFVETTVNPRLMERVARDADVAVGEPLYGDSLGAEGSGAEDYIGMMRANTEAIVTALRHPDD